MRVSFLSLLPLALSLLACEVLQAQKPTRLLAPGGEDPTSTMSEHDISGDGSVIVFSSGGSNLGSNSTNISNDIFLYEIESQNYELISVSSAGASANGFCGGPVCSGDGSMVAFWSFATSLDPADSNAGADVFLRDRTTGETIMVSKGPTGTYTARNPSISSDGEWVAFETDASHDPIDTNGSFDVYVYQISSGKFFLASLSNTGNLSSSSCTQASVSDSGKFVSFRSSDSNLVSLDTNGKADVFVRSLVDGTTVIAGTPAVPNLGSGGGSLSADGKLLVFHSEASNLVSDDTNDERDVFVQEISTQKLYLVSRTLSGAVARGASRNGKISGNQRFVVFSSEADDFGFPVPLNTLNLIRYDLLTEESSLVNKPADGSMADDGMEAFANTLDDSGELVVFSSFAGNLVPGDQVGTRDLFIADYTPEPTVYCQAKLNSLGCLPRILAKGEASMSGAGYLHLDANDVLNKRAGLFFYGLSGAAELPYFGGTLCVVPPLRRTPIQFSGGNAGPPDCSGSYSFDFNPWLASGSEPNAAIGSEVHGQYWSRDPFGPLGVGLTDAVRFLICP